MRFSDIVRKAWSDNRLFSVLLELTYRCNLDCFFCYNDLSLRGRPLTKGQYFELLDDLRRLEVLNLILSGGEPLAHPDFLDIGARARSLGFVVRIKSNGHALRGEMARRIRDEIDPFVVEVSLHGATAETHDRQTRVAGSFGQLVENLSAARRLGLRLKINSTLTRWNEHEVGGMLDLADEIGVPLQFDPEVTARDDGDSSPLAISPSPEGIERLLRLLRSRAAESRGDSVSPAMVGRQDEELAPTVARDKHCGAGSSTVAVDPFGTVYPCVQWRRSVGSLHDQTIEEIWNGSAVLGEVRQQGVAIKQMVDGFGAGGRHLGFCPGSAEAVAGSPFAVAASQLQRMETSQRVGREELLPVLR